MSDRAVRKEVVEALADVRDAIADAREDLNRGRSHTSSMCLACHHGPAATVSVLHCSACHVDTFAQGRHHMLTCRECGTGGQATTYRYEDGSAPRS